MDEFEQAILDVFNQSQLPLEAKKYVLKHLYLTVDLKYQFALEQAERERKNDVGGADGENR